MAMRHGRPFLVRRGKMQSYRIPEFEERDDGYDGHLEWTLTDHNLLMMAVFRNAVFAKDFDKVKSTVQTMIPAFQNDSQIDYLCSRICDRSSVEPLKEALLTAICIGSRPLVEFILALFNEYPGEERSGCYDSVSFMPHMTPLMMACVCNNFAIVECLLVRSHEIDLPHRPDCVCETCFYATNTVSNSIQRLDAYRALSSEAFLWLATSDPVQAAIRLSYDLKLCVNAEPNHKEIYCKLDRNVQHFATSLIQQCWSMEEVDVLLRQPDGSTLSDAHLPYPRVRLALDGQMKHFLAHLNVQVAVENKWYGRWADYGRNPMRDLGRMVRHTLLFPILALLHAISAGRLIESFNYPIARFASFTTSYLCLLVSIVAVRIIKYNQQPPYDRDLLNNKALICLEMYNFLFVCGLMLMGFLEFSRRGIERFFVMWWRWFDYIFFGLFAVAGVCWCTTIVSVESDGLYTLHRRHWVEYDSFLLYDIFYSAGCLMAFWRIFYFVQLYRFVGSTVISIGKCVTQIYHYFITMAILMACFAIGMHTLLSPYTGNKETNDNGELVTMASHFMDLPMSMRNLFWSFYGYLHPADYNVVVGDSGPDQTKTPHRLTRNTAEIIVAIYYIVMVIALLNLMISMLVRTADEVLENEDVEWKYTRIYIYYEYFERTSAVPPPFNMIFFLSSFVYRLLSKEYTVIWPDLFVKNDLISNADTLYEDRTAYRNLITRLFQRYRSSKEFHFKTIQTIDLDKEKKSPMMKVAFMNAPPNSKDVGSPIDKNHPLVQEFQRNQDEKSRKCTTCHEKIEENGNERVCRACAVAPKSEKQAA